MFEFNKPKNTGWFKLYLIEKNQIFKKYLNLSKNMLFHQRNEYHSLSIHYRQKARTLLSIIRVIDITNFNSWQQK